MKSGNEQSNLTSVGGDEQHIRLLRHLLSEATSVDARDGDESNDGDAKQAVEYAKLCRTDKPNRHKLSPFTI